MPNKKKENMDDPGSMGNPAVVTTTAPGDDMRERQIMEPNLEDIADYSLEYKANPKIDKETKDYTQSRGYYHGGEVCKGGGKAIRGTGFKGVK